MILSYTGSNELNLVKMGINFLRINERSEKCFPAKIVKLVKQPFKVVICLVYVLPPALEENYRF